MASKKYLEVAGHSDEALRSELEKAEREYQQIRFDHYTRGLDNVSDIKTLRRDIARLKTEQTKRSLTSDTGEGVRARKQSRRLRMEAKNA